MTQVRIKDNALTHKDEFEDIEILTKRIADKTLEQLSNEGVFIFPEAIKDAVDITKEQMILQSVNDCYRTSNVMGFLGYGNARLAIESRFSTGTQDYFFQYLLERVLDFPNVLELNADCNLDKKLFHLLLFLFPVYLKSAMRKGIFKTYIHNPYNDSNVKGTIDIARHMRSNTPFVGRISYNQREFSYDNYLMELIRHTIEFIKMKSYGNKMLRSVAEEVAAVIDATAYYAYHERGKTIETNKKNPIRHAYYREYRMLQRLCIMILQHERHQIGSGARQIHGILFDGAWLWEEYLHTFLGDLFYHPRNKGRIDAQRLFAGKGVIYPDFISRNSKNRSIADAKYKPIDNIGNKDYLQVLAYMFRFDAKNGYYLYPESGENDVLALRLCSGSTYEDNVAVRDDISLTKFGLRIPSDAENYDQFKELMEGNEQAFKCQLIM